MYSMPAFLGELLKLYYFIDHSLEKPVLDCSILPAHQLHSCCSVVHIFYIL